MSPRNISGIYSDDVLLYLSYVHFRSLDVLGTTAGETQSHLEDRRRSSFSPRRTSGASSVSGSYVKLRFVNETHHILIALSKLVVYHRLTSYMLINSRVAFCAYRIRLGDQRLP